VAVFLGEGHQDVEGRRQSGRSSSARGGCSSMPRLYPHWLYCQWSDCRGIPSLAVRSAHPGQVPSAGRPTAGVRVRGPAFERSWWSA
jgi:hypothetical protein